MAVTEFSRYRYCTVLEKDDENRTKYFDEREPFRFVDETDNRIHLAVDGDTWWGLCHRYFPSIPRKAGLFWLLCEFQPEPVIDPTLCIKAGTRILIPSERLVRTKVFSKERLKFHH